MTVQNDTRAPRRTPKWTKAFLAVYGRTANVALACRRAKVGSRMTVYRHAEISPEFAAEWDEAHERAMDRLEQEAWRRAVRGVQKPVLFQGKICGTWVDADGNTVSEQKRGARFAPIVIREYSDTLLVTLLKAGLPNKYRERIDHKVSGSMRHKHALNLTGLTDAQLDQIDAILTEAADTVLE